MNTLPSRSAVPPAHVDRDAPTPRISGSFSAFRDAAIEIVEQLRHQPTSMLIQGFRARANALADAFGRWPASPPDTLQRSEAIQQLMDLREQVRSYLEGDR